MRRRLNIDDLTDAQKVAETLGLAHRSTVNNYETRYPDMPRPVVDLGRGRPMPWLRPEIERWHDTTVARGQSVWVVALPGKRHPSQGDAFPEEVLDCG